MARREPTPEEVARGRRLRAIRESQGLKQVHIAVALDCGQDNVRLYESGHNQISMRNLRAWADALTTPARKITPHDLFEVLYPIGELESVGGAAELTPANAGLYLSDLLDERAAALAAGQGDRARVAELDIISKADNCTTRHMRTRSGGRNAALVPSQAMA